MLRILLRDVVGLIDLAAVCREQSALAEACLLHVNEVLGGNDLTIIAMGKFGGRESGYGADLDVLFVGDAVPAAQKLMSAVAQPSAEGNLSRLDARLRPEGEKGPLVSSLESYRRYYASRAQLWELQALTRARPLTGPLQDQFLEIAQQAWHKAGQEPHLYNWINDMLERIRRDRGSGSDFTDFKTGTGGIIEAEFLVQGLQMRKDIWQPNWVAAVDSLRSHGELSGSDAAELNSAYNFLRRCESILRRRENTSLSNLPADPGELVRFCRRMGFVTIDEFKLAYEAARSSIHKSYLGSFSKPSPKWELGALSSGPDASGARSDERT